MNWRFDLGKWHFHIGLSRSAKVQGVNSKLPDGKHFLMWDFDDVSIIDITVALNRVQNRFDLPNIYLVNTGLPDHWHAYCFKAVDYPQLLYILASTDGIDGVFFKIGVIRGFFTLRYSPKKGREFEPAIVLPSKAVSDVNPFELSSFIQYWTKRL